MRTALVIGRGHTSPRRERRSVWTGFAGWIILALEFALAADIVRLAAIAVIRTALNYFLEKDLGEFDPDAEPETDPPVGAA